MIGSDCRTWHFDHRSHQIVDFYLSCFHDLFSNPVHGSKLVSKFFSESYEWDHYFRVHFDLGFAFKNLCGRFKNRAGLHFRYLGMKNTKPASATTEHWVFLVKRFDPFDYKIKGYAQFFSELAPYHVVMWQELMKWRIEQSDCNWPSVHCFEQPYEVFPLKG